MLFRSMTIADGGAVTFSQEAQFSSGVQTAGSIETATIDYTDGDLAMSIADGGGVTTSGDLTIGTSLQTATIDYTDGYVAMTIADGGGWPVRERLVQLQDLRSSRNVRVLGLNSW